jgi:AraC-like DNA-binding protein
MSAAARRQGGRVRTTRQSLERIVRTYVRDCAEKRTAARVSELAQRFKTHPSYLSRAASAVLGRQVRTAMREEQLAIAKGLLRTTELPVEEIAARSAFGTPSTFYRAFRKAYGLRPTEYRRANKR